MESWIQRYAPKRISELHGRQELVSKIQGVFEKQPCATILIAGKAGVGKTALATLILSEALSYSIVRYDSITHKNDRLLDHLTNVNRHNIIRLLKDQGAIPTHPTALLIDNLDTISLSSEKCIIDSIITTNVKQMLFPLVLVVDTSNPKVIDDIKGVTHVFDVEALPREAMASVLHTISEKQPMHLAPGVAESVMNFCQGDIRFMVTLLQDLCMCFPEEHITPAMFEAFTTTNTKSKVVSRHLFESFQMLLLSKGDIPGTLEIYNNDKVLLPLLLQENLYKDMHNRGFDCQQKMHAAKHVSGYISEGDIIETHIYTEQNWYLQDMHCFTSCTIPINFLDSQTPYSDKRDINYAMTFSSELNKTSLKNINRKNIGIIHRSSKIPVSDLHSVSSLFNELIRKEKYDTVRQLATTYSDDPLKFVETVIKINKCTTASPLSSKAKKIIGSAPKPTFESAERKS